MESSFIMDKSISSVKFSIPKQERFQQQNALCEKMYEQKSQLSNRSTNMGYGQKVSIECKKNVPGPANYSVTKNFLKKNAIQISLGRNDVSFNQYLPKTVTNSGPGEYQKIIYQKTQQQYSMGLKLKPLKKENYPGPGRYQIEEMKQNKGSFINSQMLNTKNTIFNPTTSARFLNIKNYSPGIGSYNLISERIKGTYKESQFKSSSGKTFYKQARSTLDITNIAPGPGSYNLPSIFS